MKEEWYNWIPLLGNESALKRLDKVFSRQMLGSVFVGGAASKMVETLVQLAAPELQLRFFAWMLTFVLALFLFIYWEQIEAKVTGDD